MQRVAIPVALLCFTGDASCDLGWGKIAANGVDVHQIPGLHRTLLRANVAEVGRRLKECLARAQQSRLGETTVAA